MNVMKMTAIHLAAMLSCTAASVANATKHYVPDSDDCKKWPLHCAAAVGDEYLIERLVSFGFGVNEKDSDQLTPLAYAVVKRQPKAIEALLRLKADPNSDAAKKQPLIHWTVQTGDLEIATILLKGGADPNFPDGNGNQPLHVAAIEGRDEMAKALLSAKANPNGANSLDLSPLQVAAQAGRASVCSVLIANGASLERKDRWLTMTAMHFAVKAREIQVIQLLLDHGADVNAMTQNRVTPLALVWSLEVRDVIEVLVKASASLHPGGRPLLLYAAESRSMDFIAWLLDHGLRGEINKNFGSETPLSIAITKNNLGMARLFLENGAAATAKHKRELIIGSHLDFIRLFAEFHVNFNDGDSLLYAMEDTCSTDAAMILLTALKVDPDKLGSTGKIPILIATKKSCNDIAKLLLDAGANPNVRDTTNLNYSVLTMATIYGRAEIARALIDAGATINMSEVQTTFNMVLGKLCGNNSPQIFSAVWSKVKNLNGDKNGNTFAHLLASSRGFSLEACKPVFQEFASVSGFLDRRNKAGDLSIHDFYSTYTSAGLTNMAILASGTTQIDTLGSSGGTPLQIACSKGLGKYAEALHENGASLSARGTGRYNRSPFLMCLESSIDDFQHVEFWLRNAIDPNTADADGNRALHITARMGKTKSALVLCRGGGDVDLKNETGESPKDIAREKGGWTNKVVSNCSTVSEHPITLPSDRNPDRNLFDGVPYHLDVHSYSGSSLVVGGCYQEYLESGDFRAMALSVRGKDGKALWGRRVVDAFGNPTKCDEESFVIETSNKEVLIAARNTLYSYDSDGFLKWQKRWVEEKPFEHLAGLFEYRDPISNRLEIVAVSSRANFEKTEFKFRFFSHSGELSAVKEFMHNQKVSNLKAMQTNNGGWRFLYRDQNSDWHLFGLSKNLEADGDLVIVPSHSGAELNISDVIYDSENRVLYFAGSMDTHIRRYECFLEAQNLDSGSLWRAHWGDECYLTGGMKRLENGDFVVTSKTTGGDGQFLRIGGRDPQIIWRRQNESAGILFQPLAENIFFTAKRGGRDWGRTGVAYDLDGNIVWAH